MKRFACMVLLIALVVTIGAAVLMLSRAIEARPLVTIQTVPGVEEAARARAFGQKALRTLFRPQSYPTLSVSQDELEALSSFMARGTTRLYSEVKISPAGMDGALTLRLPDNPLGDFLNVRCVVLPSSRGLALDRVFIGPWPIPEPLALFLAKYTADFLLGDQLGSIALQSIRGVDFAENSLAVSFFPGPLEKLRKSLRGVRQMLGPVGDPEVVRFYFRQLSDILRGSDRQAPMSLADSMGTLFQVAQSRSQDRDPVEENRALILALAMYFGSLKFEALIGPVLTEELSAGRPENHHVVLGGRRDLRLHFIISAGLQILADSGMGFAVGEFKELLDATHGGSGFSFVDLAADRAGGRFAEVATASEQSARRVQQVLADKAGEAVFFPEVYDLPEGLGQSRFESRYQDVQSIAYQKLVSDIDQRIERLLLYKEVAAQGRGR